MTAKEIDVKAECYKVLASFLRGLETTRDIAHRNMEESREKEDYAKLYTSSVTQDACEKLIAWAIENHFKL